MHTLRKRLIIGILPFISFCGSQPSQSELNARNSCVSMIHDYESKGATLDQLHRATGYAVDGQAAFKVNVVWNLETLSSRKPVNQATLMFFDSDGNPAKQVEFDSFRLVMAMGHHAHTNDECPAVPTLIRKLGPNIFRIENIKFIMSSRQPNQWFFHKLTAKVDGVKGSVARLDIPHRVD